MKMYLSPSDISKVLYFDRPDYGKALSNAWSDFDLVMMNIRMGCKQGVEELIDFGCRIEKPGKYGATLSMAVKNGWTKVAKKILDQGARVSDAAWDVSSPLRCAFVKKKLIDADGLINAMLERHLLETKADFVHEDGLSFFHIACARSEMKFVKDFLQGGQVNVDAQVSNSAKRYPGYSALHFAVKFKRDDVIELLMKRGANLRAQDVNGSTALHLAFYEQNWVAVNRLLVADRDKKDIANNYGLTHFMIACTIIDSLQAEHFLWKARRVNGIHGPSILICKKVNPTARKASPTFTGYSPLHFAATFGRLNIVRLILSYSANCCTIDSNCNTPLEIAKNQGYLEICRVLERYCSKRQKGGEKAADIFISGDDSGYESASSFTNSLVYAEHV